MNTIFIVLFSSITAAIFSAALTVFLLSRYYIFDLKRKEKFSLNKSLVLSETPHSNTNLLTDLDVSLSPPSHHEKILDVFSETNINNKTKKFFVSKAPFSLVLNNFLISVLVFLDKFLDTFFNYVSLILLPIISPIYKSLHFLEKTIIDIKFLDSFFNLRFPRYSFGRSSLIKVGGFFNTGLINFFRSKTIDSYKTKPDKIKKSIASQSSIVIEKVNPKSVEVENSKIVTKNFFEEIALGLTPFVLVAIPFLVGVHKISLNLVLIFLLACALLGSFTLIKLKSPRGFWAFGISIWLALSFLFFAFNIDGAYHVASGFLCVFLFIYALSAYIWYGEKEYRNITLEYALFILHPFLYLAGIYLLLESILPMTAALLHFSIGALYLHFSETVRRRDGLRTFVFVSRFVAFVSILSSILILLSGYVEMLALFCIYAIIHKYKNIFSNWYILPVLFVTTIKVFETVNTANQFTPIINERFFAYACATFMFLHAFVWTKNKLFNFGPATNLVKNFFAVMFVSVIFFGGTLEILDIKNNISNKMLGISGVLMLIIFYLIISFWLFMFGKKRGERSLVIMSTLLSLYSVYLISTYLI